MRQGVLADSDVSVIRFEPAAWHNPYRMRDLCDRLRRALAHPLLDEGEPLVRLGDVASGCTIPAGAPCTRGGLL
jgi:hypothetical protein